MFHSLHAPEPRAEASCGSPEWSLRTHSPQRARRKPWYLLPQADADRVRKGREKQEGPKGHTADMIFCHLVERYGATNGRCIPDVELATARGVLGLTDEEVKAHLKKAACAVEAIRAKKAVDAYLEAAGAPCVELEDGLVRIRGELKKDLVGELRWLHRVFRSALVKDRAQWELLVNALEVELASFRRLAPRTEGRMRRTSIVTPKPAMVATPPSTAHLAPYHGLLQGLALPSKRTVRLPSPTNKPKPPPPRQAPQQPAAPVSPEVAEHLLKELAQQPSPYVSWSTVVLIFLRCRHLHAITCSPAYRAALSAALVVLAVTSPTPAADILAMTFVTAISTARDERNMPFKGKRRSLPRVRTPSKAGMERPEHSPVAPSPLKEEDIFAKAELVEELFRTADKDGSGTLSVQEFVSLVDKADQSLRPYFSRKVFQAIDTDNSGTVTLWEFMQYLAPDVTNARLAKIGARWKNYKHKVCTEEDEREIAEIFDLWVKSAGAEAVAHRVLTFRDLRMFISERSIDNATLRAAIAQFDEDGDGGLDVTEFTNLMSAAYERKTKVEGVDLYFQDDPALKSSLQLLPPDEG